MLKFPIDFPRESNLNNSNQIRYERLCGLALIALIIRLLFAFSCENTHHPDEIYQYLEPAHRLVFGYGFITWEYRFGARSWLIPFFVSGPLFLCKLAHCAEPAIYIPLVKSVFCLLSLSLIFSSFIIGKYMISEKAGWLSAIFCAFWYELIYFSFRPLSDILSAYFVMAAIACLFAKSNRYTPWLFGLSTALSIAIRLQQLPAAIYLLALSLFIFNRQQLLKTLVAFAAVAISVGYLDYLTWGQWFISYYNTFLFQWIYGVSNIWGRGEPLFYLKSLLSASTGILPIAFLISFFFLKRLWMLIGLVVIEILVHSLIPHKDYRFIFTIIPALLIITAAVIVLLIERKRLRKQVRPFSLPAISLAISIISLIGIFNALPGERRIYLFKPLFQSQDHKLALLFLSKESDLAGVCVQSSACNWWDSGGYYYLHRNVPIYFTTRLYEVLQLGGLVSHWLCWESDRSFPAFDRIAKIDHLEIRRRLDALPLTRDDTLPKMPPHYSTDILQPGIDGKYKPTVHPFLN